MQMPTPTEGHRQLERLVGKWTGEEKIFPSPWDPKGGHATGLVHNRATIDGFAVVQDYAQQRGAAVTYRGHGVFRYDQETSRVELYWFDSMGMAPAIYRGSFDGDVLTLTHERPQGHSRAVFDFSGHHARYRYRMEVSPDGAHWHPFIEGDYLRDA
jgi:hypothetical protein